MEMGKEKEKGERENWSTSCRVCTQTTSIKTRGTGSIGTFRHSREKKQDAEKTKESG